MKRVLIAVMHHESNTFNPIITGREDFSVQYGDEIFGHINDGDSISGIVRTLRAAGYEIVPTIRARAVPNGEISRSLYLELKNEILRRARDARNVAPVDALCLALHGSMRIEGIGDAEGDLLEALHDIFPGVPVLAALDMHATFTEKMFSYAQGFVGYKCAPHTDQFETGEHAARMVRAVLENGARPVMAWVKIPFLVAGEKSETSTEPMSSLMAALRECEKQEGVLAANFLMGFPWADGPDSGCSALIVTDGDGELARKEALRLTELFWSMRERFVFHTETYEPAEALDAALAAASSGPTPVYLSDSGDNPTAGSSADCTGFYSLLRRHEGVKKLAHPVLYGGIYDPAAVAAAKDRLGETMELTFGAGFDRNTTPPVTATGKVKAVLSSWGDYEADLVLFGSENIDLVLTSKHIGFVDPDMFRDLGQNPEEREIVVCKLGYLTAPHRLVARRSIMALTEGSSNEVLENLPYRRIPRPLFPVDRDFDFEPESRLSQG